MRTKFTGDPAERSSPIPDPAASEGKPAAQSRSKSMLICVGLLACSAIMIAMDRRGVVDGIAKEMVGWAGLFLGLSGGLWLLQLWAANRFRISIGRVMALVVLIAVLCQAFLIYRDWIRTNQPKKPVAPTNIPVKGVPADEFVLPAN